MDIKEGVFLWMVILRATFRSVGVVRWDVKSVRILNSVLSALRGSTTINLAFDVMLVLMTV